MAGPTMPTSSNPMTNTPTSHHHQQHNPHAQQHGPGSGTMNTPLGPSGAVSLANTPAGAAALGTPGVLPSSKTWELSDYELNRVPQEAITDGSEIAVSPRALHSELMCPICLDMLHNTMTTKECLHRFCSECIITALRSGNKECPTCRKKLVSKRSLRHDPNFDQLISKIYPSRDEYEQQQQKTLAKLTKTHTQLALATSSIEESMKQQLQRKQQLQQQQQAQNTNAKQAQSLELKNGTSGAQIPPTAATATLTVASIESSAAAAPPNGHAQAHGHGLAISVPTPPGAITVRESTPGPNRSGPESVSVSIPGDSSSSSSGYSEEVTEVELVFKPHPTLGSNTNPQNQNRYIKTTANASIQHLAKYLEMRLALDSITDGSPQAAGGSNRYKFTIWICKSGSPDGKGDFVEIQQSQTLAAVCENHWKFNKPLEMFYSWEKVVE